jgi:glycosyltransferase involved in cell wall biosynthesis
VMPKAPKVSIIMPAFNAAATVADAVDSALQQTYRDFELLVVDDGSTDPTSEILAQYADQIRVIHQPNAGLSAARNAALRIAQGDYVAFLDADDIWLPTMLERTVAALEQDPSSVLVYTNLAVVDSKGAPLGTALIAPALAHAPSLTELLTSLWPIMPSAVVMRRAVLEKCGGFSEAFRSYGYEDAWCWIRAREYGGFRYIPECLVKWRFSLFPLALKKPGGDRRSSALFARLVRQRYGVSAAPLVRSRLRAARSISGFIGLKALRDGDKTRAREAFRLALRLDRWRLKNYLRMLRTYMPNGLARALTGSTRYD